MDAATIVHPVSPTLYGLMTEEINHSYEGGLYAQLISNNTFRGNWMGVESWGEVLHGNAKASFAIDKTEGPSAALPTSLKISVDAASPGNEAGVNNVGFWGIAVRPHTVYRGSLYAKQDGDMGLLSVRLVSDNSGATLAETQVELAASGWSRYEFLRQRTMWSSLWRMRGHCTCNWSRCFRRRSTTAPMGIAST